MFRVRVLVVLGFVLLGISAGSLANHYFGHSRAGVALSDAPLPLGVGVPTGTATTTTASRSPTSTPTTAPPQKVKEGVPVRVVVGSHGMDARVSADAFNSDGSLFVPEDPLRVSWARQYVAPGATKGTIVLIGHISFNGVQGAFSDLPEYQIGQGISLVLSDGRTLKYVVAASPIEVPKSKVVGRKLTELFDQDHRYGQGDVKTSRLLLVTCGGVFDNRTGHYESNIFVYALPAQVNSPR